MDTNEQALTTGRRRRRHHSVFFKAEAVGVCQQPGVSIASVVLARGLNANLLRRWVQETERGDAPIAIRSAKPSPAIDNADNFAPISLSSSSTATVTPAACAILALPSGRFWRRSQLGAKLAFLRAGLGYGSLPLHLIEADLASGALVQIRLEDAPREGHVIFMSTIYRTDSPPGPTGRWFIERLEDAITERANEKRSHDRRYEHQPPGVSDHLVLVRS